MTQACAGQVSHCNLSLWIFRFLQTKQSRLLWRPLMLGDQKEVFSACPTLGSAVLKALF